MDTRQGPRLDNGADFLTVRDAARYFNTSEKAIRHRMSRGLLPYRRIHGRLVLLRAELDAIIESAPGVRLDEAQHNAAMRRGEVAPR